MTSLGPLNHARRQARSAALACVALIAQLGCAAIGFDPLEDSANPLPQGGDGSGGSAGSSITGGQGGAGGQGGQGGGSGNAGQSGGGSGGDSGDGGDGGGAGTSTQSDASVSMPDAGPPGQCAGKENGTPCDDGLFCTYGDSCFIELCTGFDRTCEDECNEGTCDERNDTCDLVPKPNDTTCGRSDQSTCEDGTCPDVSSCSEGGECFPSCDTDCEIDCISSNSCRPACVNGSECEVDCRESVECKLECADSTCGMQCERAGTCDMRCSGETTVCSIICTDPSGCENSECLDRADCALRCLEEPESCQFKECWGAEQRCADGTVLCGEGDCADEERWSGWSGG